MLADRTPRLAAFRRLVCGAATIALVATGSAAMPGVAQAASPPAEVSAQSDNVIVDGPNGAVNAIAKGSDGTTYMTGSFTAFGPQTGSAAMVNKTTGALDRTFPWVNGNVSAVAPDGSGGYYIGGSFTMILGQTRNCLAQIDADGDLTSWNPNVTLSGTCVNAIAVSGGLVYIGGTFLKVGTANRNRIAAVNASDGSVAAWNPNANNTVSALVVDGDYLYAGGSFSTIGGSSRSRIAALNKSDGTATDWNPNAAGGNVNCLLLSNGLVYAGGSFSSIGGQTRSQLAAVEQDDATATDWDPNASGAINTMALSGSTLYVGGLFSTFGPTGQTVTRNKIAAFDLTSGSLTSWDPNADQVINAIVATDDAIYVGGNFANIGGQSRSRFAALSPSDGTASSLNPQPNGEVLTLAVGTDSIFLGGKFTMVGPTTTRNYAAAIDSDGSLTSWNPSLSAAGLAIAASGSSVYVGGSFTSVNTDATSTSRNHIAEFNTSTGTVTSWNPGSSSTPSSRGVNGDINTIAVDQNRVYIGGAWNQVDGLSQFQKLAAISRTDGTFWSGFPVIGSGNGVNTLCLSGTQLFVGGNFSKLNSSNGFSNVAAIDVSGSSPTVSSWKPAVGGSSEQVWVIAASSDTLYLAGSFGNVGSSTRNRVAAFAITPTLSSTPNSWNPSISNGVRALAISGGIVYLGGIFNVGKLAAVSATGSGTNLSWAAGDPVSGESVKALIANDGTVSVAGAFGGMVTASGPPTQNLTLVPTVDQTVTFNANDGTTSTTSQTTNKTTPLAANTFTRNTYAFAGWGTSAGGPVVYADGADYSFTSDITLYAQWQQSVVTFDPNGGDGTLSYQGGVISTPLNSNTFTRAGYTFAGWGASAGGPVTYADGASYAFTSSTTLYAQWAANQTVTFDGNGGSGTMTPQVTGVPTTLTANTFTNPGYNFTGWGTSSGGPVVYADGATYPFDADITLYAQWIHANRTVTFDANGGYGTMAPQVANSPTALTSNSFTRASYTFAGWGTSASGPVVYSDGVAYPFDADTTLYAQWIHANQAVTFDANGGTGTMAPQIANSPDALRLNAFQRSGFTFIGWSTTASGPPTYADGAAYPFDADITLFAQWSANPVPEDTPLPPPLDSKCAYNSCANADLSRIDLSNMNLTGINFAGADLSYSNLVGATLNGNSFSQANLKGANLRKAVVTNTNFSGANLKGANLSLTDLRGAIFVSAQRSISRANLSGANLSRAKLMKTDLNGVHLTRANLTRANLRGANLTRAQLVRANLTRTQLASVTAYRANFNHALFKHANLRGARLAGSTFKHATFQSTKLPSFSCTLRATSTRGC